MVKNFAVKMFSYCPIYENFEHTKKALAVKGQLTIERKKKQQQTRKSYLHAGKCEVWSFPCGPLAKALFKRHHVQQALNLHVL
jgi:hypothetical protein